MLKAFAIFCGMGISNTHMYEQVVKAMARQSIALDILTYHTSASVEEVQRLKVPSHYLGIFHSGGLVANKLRQINNKNTHVHFLLYLSEK